METHKRCAVFYGWNSWIWHLHEDMLRSAANREGVCPLKARNAPLRLWRALGAGVVKGGFP